MPNRKRERKYHSRRSWEKRVSSCLLDAIPLEKETVFWGEVGKANKIYDKIREMMEEMPPKNIAHLSSEAMGALKSEVKPSDTVNIFGIEIKFSPLFPFELPDGSICHGVVIPVDPPPEAYDSPVEFF